MLDKFTFPLGNCKSQDDIDMTSHTITYKFGIEIQYCLNF